MPIVRVSFTVPYLLALTKHSYKTGNDNPSKITLQPIDSITWSLAPANIGMVASCTFKPADGLSEDRKEAEKIKRAKILLAEVNRLLRWYRAAHCSPDTTELTLAQASPVRFTIGEMPDETDWAPQFEREADAPIAQNSEDVAKANEAIASGFASEKQEPLLADLLILDANHAVQSGLFRQAILLSWAAIEGTFHSKFDQLVKEFLPGNIEWKEGSEWLTDSRFGLRHKMTVGMRSVVGMSMYEIMGSDKWQEVGQSYKCRNNVVHNGFTATEEDARQAVQVADYVYKALKKIDSHTSDLRFQKSNL